MGRYLTRMFTVVAGVAVGTLGAVAASAPAAPAQQGRAAGLSPRGTSAAGDGPLWVKRYNGPGNYGDHAYAIAASPNGRTVFATGLSIGIHSGPDFTTIAYNAATGAWLWGRRYNGPGSKGDRAWAVAVSPDGRTVFVTGDSAGSIRGDDYATVAYSAATGAQLWVSRYHSPGNGESRPYSLAVSPDGTAVFVTGRGTGPTSDNDYVTVAYRAATGAQLWASRYNGPDNSGDTAFSVAVSPDSGTVFVTGSSTGSISRGDYLTVAYNAATGAQLWASRYAGPDSSDDLAVSVAASPTGKRVFVTGTSGRIDAADYVTVAYNAATGTRLWTRRYNSRYHRGDRAASLAASPDGTAVYVTGASAGPTADDYATVAYNAATGTQLWTRRYNGPANLFDIPSAVTASPGGTAVYVTGSSAGTKADNGDDYATIAYNATTGSQLWARRYNGPGNGIDGASSIAASPSGATVFVTGSSTGTTSRADYATIAYRIHTR